MIAVPLVALPSAVVCCAAVPISVSPPPALLLQPIEECWRSESIGETGYFCQSLLSKSVHAYSDRSASEIQLMHECEKAGCHLAIRFRIRAMRFTARSKYEGSRRSRGTDATRCILPQLEVAPSYQRVQDSTDSLSRPIVEIILNMKTSLA